MTPLEIFSGLRQAATQAIARWFGFGRFGSGAAVSVRDGKRATSIEPDYANWRRVEILTLWQAACLWCDSDPQSRKAGAEVATQLTVLRDSVMRGDLKLVGPAGESAYDFQRRRRNPKPEYMTTRVRLREFAEKRGEVPRFLRDDER